jgi:hypothetical protein
MMPKVLEWNLLDLPLFVQLAFKGESACKNSHYNNWVSCKMYSRDIGMYFYSIKMQSIASMA